MSKHAILSPSSAYRWLKCPASAALTQHHEIDTSKSSPAAEEGTRLHKVMQDSLENYCNDDIFGGSYTDDLNELAKELKERGEPLASQALKQILNYLLHRDPFNPKGFTYPNEKYGYFGVQEDVELYLTNSAYHPFISGTIDLLLKKKIFTSVKIMEPMVIESKSFNRYLLIDYKFGKHPVGDSGIQQLRTYVSLTGQPIENCTALIIQPQCSDEAIEVELVDGHAGKCLKAIERYKALTQKLKVSALDSSDCFEGAHCRFCPAYSICPLKNSNRQDKLLDMLSVIEEEEDTMELVTTNELVQEYIEGKKLAQRLSDVEKELTKRLDAGEEHEQIMLKPGNNTRSWYDDKLAEVEMATISADSKAPWVAKLKSPAQFEKYLKDNFSNRCKALLTKIDPHVNVKPGKLKLTIVE